MNRLYQEERGRFPHRATKHIYVGETRIASTISRTDRRSASGESTYYYHGDHLGSSNMVTDEGGKVCFEQLEYTPWGETWVEESRDTLSRIDWRFTAQEYDPETGLYAFPARYYEPQTSRWMSPDPAMGKYLPSPGQKPEDLPAGGVFQPVNLNPYHYGGNNPVVVRDPTGMFNLGEAISDLGASIGLWKSDEQVAEKQRQLDNEVYGRFFNESGQTLANSDELYAEFQQWMDEGPDSGQATANLDELTGFLQAKGLANLGAIGRDMVRAYLKTGNRELGRELARLGIFRGRKAGGGGYPQAYNPMTGQYSGSFGQTPVGQFAIGLSEAGIKQAGNVPSYGTTLVTPSRAMGRRIGEFLGAATEVVRGAF